VTGLLLLVKNNDQHEVEVHVNVVEVQALCRARHCCFQWVQGHKEGVEAKQWWLTLHKLHCKGQLVSSALEYED
jgi:hypothetical protein